MFRFLISFALLTLSVSFVSAQHDPQRNATQAIASGDFKRAEKELKKANGADPETMYVMMLLVGCAVLCIHRRFFFIYTAPTVIYTEWFVGSVRCVYEAAQSC